LNKAIRVIQVIYSFDVEGTGGGIARFAIALGRALKRKQFDIAICGLWNTGTQAEKMHIQQLKSEGLEAFTAADWDETRPILSLWKSYRGLRQVLTQTPYHIVHSHSEFSDIVTLMLKFSPGVPVIIRTLHNGFQIEWRKRFFRRMLLTNFLYPLLFNAEVGVSKHVVSNLNRRWLSRLLKHDAVLLYNGIDTTRFANPLHVENKASLGLGIPNDAFVIGTIGRLREEKGYDILLEAARGVVQQLDRIYFVIVGDGELKSSLITKAINLQIEEHVVFTGPREDVEFLLSGMDMFVCSSLWEGFSTAVLEAMAAGVPILATDIPGNRELIKPGINGWLVPARDANALTNTILTICKHSNQQRQLFGIHAQQDVQLYSMESIAEQHSRYYHRLITQKQEKIPS
jgi:glycosyltransferase involved in cell wall biosynthesis